VDERADIWSVLSTLSCVVVSEAKAEVDNAASSFEYNAEMANVLSTGIWVLESTAISRVSIAWSCCEVIAATCNVDRIGTCCVENATT